MHVVLTLSLTSFMSKCCNFLFYVYMLVVISYVFGVYMLLYLQVGSDSIQYIMDSIPNKSDLGLEYTTLPVGFGVVTDGYYIRVVAAEDNTWVTIATRAERLRQGEYLEEEIENSKKIAKIGCIVMYLFN